jgi:O-antigen ligase
MPAKNKTKNKTKKSDAPAVSEAMSTSTTPRLDAIIRGHLYALIILLPLVFWLDTATVFALPKLLVLHLLTISALFFVVLKIYAEGRFSFFLSPGCIFLGLWLASLLLSTLFSLNQLTSVFGQYGRFMGLFTFLNLLVAPLYLVSFFPRAELRRLLYVSVGTALLVALYGLLQYVDFVGLWPETIRWTDAPQNRVFATMGHANHLGAYLATNLIFLNYLYAGLGPARRRWLNSTVFLLGLLSLFGCLLLTASRGAVLAFFLVYLILLVLRVVKHRQALRQKIWLLLFAGLVIVGTAAASLLIFVDNLDSLGLFSRTEQTIASLEKGVVPERLSFLRSSWQMFLDHPLLGTGLSTFRDAYSAYRRTDYVIDGPGNAHQITVPESAHNEYANILATQGLLGLIAFLGLLGYAVYSLLRRYFADRRGTSDDYWHLAVMGGLLVFAVQVLFNFGELVNWFVFFLLIGIVLAETPSPRPISLRLPGALLLPLSVMALLALSWSFGWSVLAPARADYYLLQARLADSRGESESAGGYYLVAIGSQPLEYQFYQQYADYLLEQATLLAATAEREQYLQLAAKYYRQAILLNPNYPSAYHNLALTYLYLYRLGGNEHFGSLSRENYQKSIEKAPNNPRYLYEYARKLHSDWNERNEAVKLLRQALQIDPGYREPLDYLEFLFANHPELNESTETLPPAAAPAPAAAPVSLGIE